MALRKLKQWLVAANGWQRIWFVCSIISILYFVIIFPLIEVNEGSSFRYSTKRAIENEMKNPECAIYMNGAFAQLNEPEFDPDGKKSCYNIYIHRKYSDQNRPITNSSYGEQFVVEERKKWMMYIGVGAFIAVLLSAFVYGTGVVLSWIARGFTRGK